jgi:cation:H+ antiporter
VSRHHLPLDHRPTLQVNDKTVAVVWVVVFVVGALVMVRAGIEVAARGEELARRFGISQLLVGAILLAFVTSLPEIVTNASAALADAPELAVGSVFGSSMANMAILAVLDLAHRGRMLMSVELGQARLGAIAILLTGVAVLGIVNPSEVEIGWVGVYPLAIAAIYLLALRWLRKAPLPAVATTHAAAPQIGWRVRVRGTALPGLRFVLGAIALFVAAPLVVRAAENIADDTGIATGFFGVAFLALATSLPELFTSLAALRLGAYDLAVGNLLGSNAFNIVSLLVADLFFTSGPIMNSVGSVDVVAGLAAIGLMSIALAAIVVDPEEQRTGLLDPGPILLLVAYGVGLALAWTAAT